MKEIIKNMEKDMEIQPRNIEFPMERTYNMWTRNKDQRVNGRKLADPKRLSLNI